jgi:DNA-binding transcriptional ArsR family regulator
MGATKYSAYSENQIELAKLFKALAHPARIAIFELLLNNDDLNCKALSEKIDLAQSTISEHLKVMFDAGLLGVRTVDNNAYYKVLESKIIEKSKLLENALNILKKSKINYKKVYVKPTFQSYSTALNNTA